MKTKPSQFKHVPTFMLHEIKMGKGSLYYKGKEVIVPAREWESEND